MVEIYFNFNFLLELIHAWWTNLPRRHEEIALGQDRGMYVNSSSEKVKM